MNRHVKADLDAIASLADMIGERKFFARSLASAGFKEHLSAIRLTLPEFTGTGKYQLTAATAAGPLEAAFWIAQWHGPERPTLIYHHGNNERPFVVNEVNSFNTILHRRGEPFPANLVALRAAYHDISLKNYMARIGDLNCFMAMMGLSATLFEALTQRLRNLGGGPVALGGLSMGGWAANLHRSYYGSADVYLPLLAGTALAETFVASPYQALVGARALAATDIIRQRLNFEADFVKVKNDNVFPLLARYDQFIDFERQSQSYGGVPVSAINYGHITALTVPDVLRQHILNHLPG